MDSLRSLHVFLRVAETGSFSAVARELGLTQPSVSRAVVQLERSIGVRLLTRTTRQVTLTDAGRVLCERAGPPSRELLELAAELKTGATTPSGTVRLAAPAELGRRLVLPVVAAYLTEFPAVRVDLALTDRAVDLVQDGIDLAVRVGTPQAGSLVTRVLGQSGQRLVASPRYLATRGAIERPADLAEHVLIGRKMGGRAVRTFGALELPDESIRLTADDVGAVHDAALWDLGVALLPAWLVEPDLRAGRLRRVLPELPMPAAKVLAVLPGGRQAPLRVRALVDRLVSSVGQALAA